MRVSPPIVSEIKAVRAVIDLQSKILAKILHHLQFDCNENMTINPRVYLHKIAAVNNKNT